MIRLLPRSMTSLRSAKQRCCSKLEAVSSSLEVPAASAADWLPLSSVCMQLRVLCTREGCCSPWEAKARANAGAFYPACHRRPIASAQMLLLLALQLAALPASMSGRTCTVLCSCCAESSATLRSGAPMYTLWRCCCKCCQPHVAACAAATPVPQLQRCRSVEHMWHVLSALRPSVSISLRGPAK
jgi:hypothetical protein